MEISESLNRKVQSISRSLTSNDADFEDALSEGLIKIMGMKSGCTENYYATGAWFCMRDFLRKERLHTFREVHVPDDITGNIPEGVLPFGKKSGVPDYDSKNYDTFTDNDRKIARWLKRGSL